MSNSTIDNFIFEKITDSTHSEKPFIKKDLIFIPDNNPSSTYFTNQVQFSTEIIANNGHYNNYQEGMIAIPLVFTLLRSAGATAVPSYAPLDFLMALKNSNYNFLHSLSIDFNNTNVIQPVNYINQYLIFKLHTELSTEDENLNGATIGYAKDSSTAWSYFDAASPQGIGICNNANTINSLGGVSSLEGDISNDGIRKRQHYFTKLNTNGKNLIFNDSLKMSNNVNVVEDLAGANGGKVYYYTAYLRLKDLPFFQNMNLMRSGTFRINLTLNNNVSFRFKKLVNGNLQYITGSFSNTSGLTNPMMLCASMTSALCHDKFVGSKTAADITSVDNNAHSFPCGSACLPCSADNEYTLSVAIGKNSLGNVHPTQQCRLYLPYYTFAPQAEALYLQQKQKTIDYLELDYYSFEVRAGSAFNQLITNGTARMKRLVMVGIMTTTANEGINPMSSPFATEPSTTSPFTLSNFNCLVGQIGIYANPITYSYEQFLLEMNGQYGVNGNIDNGVVSSRISLTDYNNNYHYIVVNLDRKLPELENTPQSVSVQGTLTSLKDMTFYCFIEKYKTIVVDVETGTIVK